MNTVFDVHTEIINVKWCNSGVKRKAVKQKKLQTDAFYWVKTLLRHNGKETTEKRKTIVVWTELQTCSQWKFQLHSISSCLCSGTASRCVRTAEPSWRRPTAAWSWTAWSRQTRARTPATPTPASTLWAPRPRSGSPRTRSQVSREQPAQHWASDTHCDQ